MTIAIACNLPDGVVLGADSAHSIVGPDGKPTLVFNDGEKLFTLWKKPIAVVHYGVVTLRQRTIESHVREFEAKRADLADKAASVGEVAAELWKSLHAAYAEELKALKLEHLKPEERGDLGLLVGGFSAGEYLSEVWEISVHLDDESTAVRNIFARGVFNTAWRGMTEGLVRFHRGVPLEHADRIIKMVLEHHGIESLDDDLAQKVVGFLDGLAFQVPFWALPLQEGVHYVRFCLDVMVNQSRFVADSAGCGGSVRMAVIHNERVEWVTDSRFRLSH